MKSQKKIMWLLSLISLLAINLTGCGTVIHPSLPETGPTMADIYQQKLNANTDTEGLEYARTTVGTGWLGAVEEPLPSYTRTASNELNSLFPRLPNPTIALFVYPHLAGLDEAPVPGYTTSFTFYKEEHFALPGEVSLLRNKHVQ